MPTKRFYQNAVLFKSKIHQNKDWNGETLGLAFPSVPRFKSKIHQNKDWNYADKKVLPKRRPV